MEIFKKGDADGSGHLEFREFVQCLNQLDPDLTDAQVIPKVVGNAFKPS